MVNYCYGTSVCFFIILCGKGGVADDSGSGSWSDDDDAFELGRPASICDLYGYACAASDECDWICRDWFFYPPFDSCSCKEKLDAAALENGDGAGMISLTPAWGYCHFYLGDECKETEECDWLCPGDECWCIQKVESSGFIARNNDDRTISDIVIVGCLISVVAIGGLLGGCSSRNSRDEKKLPTTTYKQMIQTTEKV